MPIFPKDIDLDRETALTIAWSDGRVSVYPVGYLRRHSPAADARQEREEQEKNPLAVLKSPSKGSGGPFRAESVELVGHYALRVCFSDGHATGLYTWEYLREIDPAPPPELPPESPQDPGSDPAPGGSGTGGM